MFEFRKIVNQDTLVRDSSKKYIAYGKFSYRSGKFYINKKKINLLSKIKDVQTMATKINIITI
jgi:virulence-associated protein VapD